MRHSLDDPSAYPRAYGLRRWIAALWLLTGVIGILWFGFGVIYFATLPDIATENLRIFFVAVCVVMALCSVFPIVSVFKYRFVLDHDKVQLSTLLFQQDIRKDNIAGLRRRYHDLGQTITLVPKDKRTRQLKFEDYMEPDEFFESWLASIPDLDNVEGNRQA
jgi:hypothetical protein